MGRRLYIGENLRKAERGQHFKNKKPGLASGFTNCAGAVHTDSDPYPLEQESHLLERYITEFREMISNLDNEISTLSSKPVATSLAQAQSQSQGSPDRVNLVVGMDTAEGSFVIDDSVEAT